METSKYPHSPRLLRFQQGVVVLTLGLFIYNVLSLQGLINVQPAFRPRQLTIGSFASLLLALGMLAQRKSWAVSIALSIASMVALGLAWTTFRTS